MKLDEIGFYTLSDNRAKTISSKTSLTRCEIVLTDRCNFNCIYCRGLKKDLTGDIPLELAEKIIHECASHNLFAIRFSGGEPTLYPYLEDLVKLAKKLGVERIAISTNGSAPKDQYLKLIALGVNDFSVSLDACCASMGDKISGTYGFNKIIENNIRFLSTMTYTTVGVVLNSFNINDCEKIIEYADSLGVWDIRLIPAAQDGAFIPKIKIKDSILKKYPILNYRYNRIIRNLPIRGIDKGDYTKCGLVLDDLAICGNYHFPCIIYLREQGNPIGEVSSMDEMRMERLKWFKEHLTHLDPICSKNCLDVCVMFNNMVHFYGSKRG